MFKRFMLGLITGLSIMYYYLYHYEEDFDAAADTFEGAATGYSGEKTREEADRVLAR